MNSEASKKMNAKKDNTKGKANGRQDDGKSWSPNDDFKKNKKQLKTQKEMKAGEPIKKQDSTSEVMKKGATSNGKQRYLAQFCICGG